MNEPAPESQGPPSGMEDRRGVEYAPGETDPRPSGFTRFLVEGPSQSESGHEELVQAVRALLRERDYLKRARELALADFQQAASQQEQHVHDLEQLLEREALAHQQEATELKRDREALQRELEARKLEREELFEDRRAWQARTEELLVAREQEAQVNRQHAEERIRLTEVLNDELEKRLVERGEILEDRRAWQACAEEMTTVRGQEQELHHQQVQELRKAIAAYQLELEARIREEHLLHEELQRLRERVNESLAQRCRRKFRAWIQQFHSPGQGATQGVLEVSHVDPTHRA